MPFKRLKIICDLTKDYLFDHLTLPTRPIQTFTLETQGLAFGYILISKFKISYGQDRAQKTENTGNNN